MLATLKSVLEEHLQILKWCYSSFRACIEVMLPLQEMIVQKPILLRQMEELGLVVVSFTRGSCSCG